MSRKLCGPFVIYGVPYPSREAVSMQLKQLVGTLRPASSLANGS